jgi:hypothetical protein
MARTRREAIVEEAQKWVSYFPYDKMAELDWVEPCEIECDKVQALFNFFQVSTVKAWQDYYCNQQLKVAFSISLNSVKEPHAISAWLRQGERQAELLSVGKFSERQLKLVIPQIKAIMTDRVSDSILKLQELCGSAGVKLFLTPCLPKAPIKGSTRWINGTPCIQLADCLDWHDSFWFTFFHEVGHILLHGKKNVFLENVECSSMEVNKEEEADAFAEQCLKGNSILNASAELA